jgi:hypothetical protein
MSHNSYSYSLYISRAAQEYRRSLDIISASVENAFQKLLAEESGCILLDPQVRIEEGVADLEYDTVCDLSEKLKTYRQIFSDLDYFYNRIAFCSPQNNLVQRIDMVIPDVIPKDTLKEDAPVSEDGKDLYKVFSGENE